MKKILYIILRAYVWLGLQFYFSKIRVFGKSKIPKKGAIILTSNHQNAFLDALLIVTNNGRSTHFLARAEVFKKEFVKWLLSLINMMPIYRIRDGFKTLSNNEDIFKQCYQILADKKALLIFPEGNHGFERRLRPLSKGFTRIAFGTLENHSNLDLKIVPTGINYAIHQGFRAKVSIHYGDYIEVNPYYKQGHEHPDTLILRDRVSTEMQKLIVHIDEENYKEAIEKLTLKNPDFSDLGNSMELIKNVNARPNQKSSSDFISKVFYALFRINFLLPLLIWKWIAKKVQDPVMLASIKFSVGISVFPIFLLLQTFLINTFWGIELSVTYAFLSLVLPFGIKNN